MLLLAVSLHAQQPVTFYQLTDAHMFDDGWKMSTENAFRAAADDQHALSWAVKEINREIADGHPADFMVYTGDLGLQNVDFTAGRCTALPAPLENGLPPFRLDAAVEEVAQVFSALKVPRIYMLSGNNDVQSERLSDEGRFSCFMALLQQRMAKLNGPAVYPLVVSNAFVAGGLRFVGLDTTTVKAAANYQAPCSIAPQPINCPAEQINLVGDLADASPQPLVIFTHVPDLKDPFRQKPAWDIDAAARKSWEETVCSNKVVAIFAGHFHDSNREIYGVSSANRGTNPCVAAKTYVAPPLGGKYQPRTGAHARGFMRVTLSPVGIQPPSIAWYDAVDEPAEGPEVNPAVQ